MGGGLTEPTNITNASGYTFKLHLDEDDEDVGFIGDTYNSLIGFQNGNLVLSQNSGSTVVSVTSTYSSLQAASGGYSTDVLVYRNKVQINPHLGALYVDTLTNAVGTKALRYNPTTGLVSYADTTTTGGLSDSSTIIIDTTYNRIGVVVSTDTSLFKSLRIQENGVTKSPTSTDSTLSWEINAYPAVPSPDNPNNWTVIPDPRNPIFSVANMGGVVALESSMYAPSPISINDTLFRVYAKGDATNSIHYWESTDSMNVKQQVLQDPQFWRDNLVEATEKFNNLIQQ